mmetsp:Transcript_139849/g.354701  ORF Transcript_139849/g.354701 Transcript_139849/m.354701 type:complete len:100 (+) Transcript_139849:565-864(+)
MTGRPNEKSASAAVDSTHASESLFCGQAIARRSAKPELRLFLLRAEVLVTAVAAALGMAKVSIAARLAGRHLVMERFAQRPSVSLADGSRVADDMCVPS